MTIPTETTLLAPNGTPYVPLPHQQAFHDAEARYRLLYGDWSSGKTLAGAVEAVRTALLFPGSEGLVIRSSARSLAAVVWPVLAQLPAAEVMKSARGAMHNWRLEFVNGSRIWLLPMTDHHRHSVQSLAVDWVWVDEPDEIHQSSLSALQCRLRGRMGPHRLWMTGSAKDGGWSLPLFIGNGGSSDYFRVAGRASANTHLPSEYAESLRCHTAVRQPRYLGVAQR